MQTTNYKYALLTDQSVQHFTCLIKYGKDISGNLEVAECTEYPTGLESEFAEDIGYRDPTVSLNFRIMAGLNQTSWYGLSLSPNEYNRLYQMVKLYPSYERFLKLAKGESC